MNRRHVYDELAHGPSEHQEIARARLVHTRRRRNSTEPLKGRQTPRPAMLILSAALPYFDASS